MSKITEQHIEKLQAMKLVSGLPKYRDALDSAIAALEQQQSLLAERERLREETQVLVRDTIARIEHLEAALKAVMERKGPYSQNPLKHAENTILNMADLARRGLEGEDLE